MTCDEHTLARGSGDGSLGAEMTALISKDNINGSRGGEGGPGPPFQIHFGTRLCTENCFMLWTCKLAIYQWGTLCLSCGCLQERLHAECHHQEGKPKSSEDEADWLQCESRDLVGLWDQSWSEELLQAQV